MPSEAEGFGFDNSGGSANSSGTDSSGGFNDFAGGAVEGVSGGDNSGKNAEDKSTATGGASATNDPSTYMDPGGAFGLTGGSGWTGIGFIDNSILGAKSDPLGAVIDLAIGLTPAGAAFSAVNLAARAAGANPLGVHSAGGVISAAVRGAISGDVTGATPDQIAAAQLASQQGSEGGEFFPSYQPSSLAGTQSPQAATNSATPQVPSRSPILAQEPLKDVGNRGANPYGPSAQDRFVISRQWL